MDLEKQERWKKRLQNFQASGLSGAKWCEKNGIPAKQLSYWKKRLTETPKKKEEQGWISLEVDANQANRENALTIRVGTVEVEVKSGYNEKLLKDVVRMLVSLC